MVLFGFIFVVSVAGLLAVRSMDIECEHPAKPRAARPVRRETSSGFPAESMGLRQI